ncbi:MAG: acyl transferase [Proteobacteria bacterium]|nr:MAG: acyl transferase [Pseudomonadota bacterium]
MSLMGRLMAFFPLAHAILIAINLVCGIIHPWLLLVIPFSVYLFPLTVWRLHRRISPLKSGLTRFSRPEYSAWWGSYQIQNLFLLLPSLERLLHLVPGLFSAWLRAWGSEIGKQVFWTPHTLILDRSLLKFGDGIIVGHRCSFSSHVISLNKKGELLLYVKEISIESNVFIGAGSDVGPGTVVAAGSRLPLQSQLYPNQKVGFVSETDDDLKSGF